MIESRSSERATESQRFGAVESLMEIGPQIFREHLD